MTDRPKTPSFHKSIELAFLDAEGVSATLTADEADRAVLARFLDIPVVGALTGTATASRRGDLVRVKGTLQAALTRQCVASLEEMSEAIDETFEATFTTRPVEPDIKLAEIEADLDAPEPIAGDSLDLGDVLLEQLVLAMDPHPRKEGADSITDPGAGATISPFSVLKDLKSSPH